MEKPGINILRIHQTMSSSSEIPTWKTLFDSETSADGKQSTGIPDVAVEQSPFLALSPNTDSEIAVGDKRHHVAIIDKPPYCVFTHKEKSSLHLVLRIRRVGYIVTYVLLR